MITTALLTLAIVTQDQATLRAAPRWQSPAPTA